MKNVVLAAATGILIHYFEKSEKKVKCSVKVRSYLNSSQETS